MSDDQLSDQDQGCKIQNKIQDPCKPTDTEADVEKSDPVQYENFEKQKASLKMRGLRYLQQNYSSLVYSLCTNVMLMFGWKQNFTTYLYSSQERDVGHVRRHRKITRQTVVKNPGLL